MPESSTPAAATWSVVCNELHDPSNDEVIILTGLDRATATTAARSLQGMHNPDIAETDQGLNFFIRRS